MTNTVKITFNEDMQIGDHLWFLGYISYGGDYLDVQFNEQWKALRTQQYQVTYNPPTSIPGERSAIDFVDAINLDYGALGLNITRVLNVVVITSTINELSFYDEGFYGSVPNTRVSFDFYDTDSSDISITDITFSEATVNNPCTHVKAVITTSQLAENYKIAGQTVNNNENNPFEVELLREQGYILQLWNEPNNVFQSVIETIPSLDTNKILINIVPSPNGSSINIVNNLNTMPIALEIEYSLDDENWQTENYYNGLTGGDYILFIRDNFGCKKIKNFTITDTGINIPYFLYDKNNSFRMANRVDWGTGGNYKNDENTLSCEAFARNESLAYKEIQRFQTNDVITTQFKSNYPSNRAFIVLEDNTEIEIPVIQKSENIGLTDLRDAFICNLGNGKNGIYFTLGSLYDFNTGLPTGESYELNGNLPNWFGKTKYIRVNGTWFLIENIFYDEYRNAEVIVFSGSYTGNTDELVKVGVIYNREVYEIYEFTIDFDSYINSNLRIRIEATSDEWTDIVLLSELIQVKVYHEDCVEIRYWNDDNTNINYQTGIRHLLRVPIDNISGISEGESEINKTDTTTILLDSELYEADSFKFEPLTKELWRKLMRALSCKNVFINNVQYVKNGEFETEGPLEDSNLYVLTANMIKAGGVFNSQSDGLDDFDFGGSEIIGLIDSGNQHYIRY